jgi:hypothetical protein
MADWSFKKFGDEYGNSDIDGWRSGLPPKARARFNAIISYMKTATDWRRVPYITPLVGYEGIFEIKFIVQNIQYRPLGCYGPEKIFIFLIGAEERGDRFEPLSAPETAVRRKELALRDKRYVHEYYST